MPGQKSLLGAGLAAAAGIAVLIGLGTWQLSRLEWKTALLERVAANMAAAPVPLPSDMGLRPFKPNEWEYRRVCTEGTFLQDRELYFFSTDLNGNAGYHVIAVLERDGGTAVLVNRGWVPPARKDPATRAEGLPEGHVRVCGVLLADEEKRFFTPENDAAGNTWYYRDARAMAASLGLSEATPIFLDADATPNLGGYPVGGQTRIDIPNNHLGYAITWYGLALALGGVFLAFAWQRREKGANSS